MRAPDLRRSTLMRWGVAIATLLIAQSLILGGLFWQLTSAQQRRQLSDDLRQGCSTLASLTPEERLHSITEQLRADIHRERFLAAFTKAGEHLAGNVARIPPQAEPYGRVSVATIEPTQLPGVSIDVARLILCEMPDGTILLLGVDRDQAEAVSKLIERALAIGLLPAPAIAVIGGWIAANQAGRRLDAVRLFAAQIVAGDLAKRLPVSSRSDSFGMLCAQINSMLDRIEALVADVKGLGDDIAHQLRTPLTRLRARIEREMGAAMTPADFAQAANTALAEIDQSLSIVAALLRIREIDDRSRRRNFTSIDLRDLVTDVAELYNPVAECRGNGLFVEISSPVIIQGDRDLLMEAVSNLVDNAIKYSVQGTEIVIRLGRDTTARIDVTNESADFVLANSDTLFRRFRRGRNAVGIEGSGLGLSLVRAIGDLHGATVSVRREGSLLVTATLLFERPPAP